MMIRRQILILCSLLFAFLAGCSIKAPEVSVTGEKTALEEEVLGTYSDIEMEAETWMMASTRAARGEGDVKVSSEKKKVFEAIQAQKFNKDDIDEFKRKGYVGENNKGFLEVRSPAELKDNPAAGKFVMEIVDSENKDRKTIMDRVIELKDSLKQAVKDDVLNAFAQIKQKESPRGTWIQLPDGEWIKK